MKIFNYRLVIFALSIVFGVVFAIPSLMQTESGKKISLGLDLQGGLHMLLGVNTHEAVTSKIKSIATSVKYFADDEDLLIDGLSIEGESVVFTVLDGDEIPKMDEMLAKIKGLDIAKEELNYTLKLLPNEVEQTKDQAVSQAVETIRNRLDQFGLAEPTVVRQGSTDIVVQLPGIKTAADEKAARELISKPANLELMAVDEDRADQVYTMTSSEAAEYGNVILEDTRDPNTKFLVKEIPILNGSQVVDAQVAFDSANQPIINFTLNTIGAKIFGDFTSKSVGKRLAVVLDGKVYSAPVIRERIGGGSGQISGGFTVLEAGNVAIALRSGALPASVKLLEKRSVGPSLGADSIKASTIALISGFVLVFIFMIVYYRRAGIIANIALITNIFIIISVMAMFGATLTLPGMAGIVLTVGMAVDANVIISERIRELLRQGVSIQKAIEDGYANAMRAILDANITTLLVAVILYAYGTGPIKGFAITISIGILASMLTAILGTHGIYDALLPKIAKDKDLKKWFGSTDMVLRYMIAPVLSEFHQRYPGIELVLLSNDEVVSLSHMEADIALRYIRSEQLDIVQRKLITFKYSYFASPAYLDKYPVDESRPLQGHKMLKFTHKKYQYNSQQLKDFANNEIVLTSNHVDMLIDACCQGLGLMTFQQQYGVQIPGIRMLKFPPHREVSVWIASHKDNSRLPAIHAVKEFIIEASERCARGEFAVEGKQRDLIDTD